MNTIVNPIRIRRALSLAVMLCMAMAMPVAAQSPDPTLERVMGTTGTAAIQALIAELEAGSSPKKDLYVGIALHNLATGDPATWAQKAADRLVLYKGSERAALAMAYRGSAVTLVASALSAKGNLIGAAAKLNEGFGIMDKAVKADPADVAIRILRAENGLSISETTPFNRVTQVKEDVAYLGTLTARMSAGSLSQYYLMAGRLALLERRAGDAITLLEKSVAAAPGSDTAKRAAELLAELEE